MRLSLEWPDSSGGEVRFKPGIAASFPAMYRFTATETERIRDSASQEPFHYALLACGNGAWQLSGELAEPASGMAETFERKINRIPRSDKEARLVWI